MNDNGIKMLLEELRDDVRYLRAKQDAQSEQLAQLRVDVGGLKTRNRIVTWAAGFVIPAVVALLVSGAARALDFLGP